MKYEEQYGPDKSYEDLIYKTVYGLMNYLNLQDFEPHQNDIYHNKQITFILEKFKAKLADNTYWELKSILGKNTFLIILKSDVEVLIEFSFERDQIKIVHPRLGAPDICLKFKELWLSFKRLRESLIEVLSEGVKLANNL